VSSELKDTAPAAAEDDGGSPAPAEKTCATMPSP